jgi:hypothetical protein
MGRASLASGLSESPDRVATIQLAVPPERGNRTGGFSGVDTGHSARREGSDPAGTRSPPKPSRPQPLPGAQNESTAFAEYCERSSASWAKKPGALSHYCLKTVSAPEVSEWSSAQLRVSRGVLDVGVT